MGDYSTTHSINSGVFNNNAGGLARGIDNAGTFINHVGAQTVRGGYNTGQFFNYGTISSGVGSQRFYEYTQVAGQTVNNGSIELNTNITGGVLKGTGSILGVVSVNGGTIAPGDPTGTLSISNNLLFNSGTLLTTIGGRGPGQYSILNITGAASFLAGTLAFSFVDGFVPSLGDHWQFLTADGGIFGWENLLNTSFAGVPSSYAFNVSANGNSLTLTVVAVPEPEVYAMLGIGIGLLGIVKRRKKRRVAHALKNK
jgi:hypothetical protein